MTSQPVDTVHKWLAAVNAGDADAALALTTSDVVIIGPQGTARGRDVLRAWLNHAGATFAPRATFARDVAVVVAQHGVWRDPTTGAVQGEVDVATRFRVHGDQVAELERYDDLAAALGAAELSMTDEVRQRDITSRAVRPRLGGTVDEDLEAMSREQLVAEARRLRAGIRAHRDSTGHALCWHHPTLWGLLPDATDPQPTVPTWPEFLRGCLRYRQTLDEQLPNAPRSDAPYQP